jgi:phosphoribosylformylglycinamidine cyclo-ligase
LTPTHIYVAPVLALLRSGAQVKALVHITGDGLLNLGRIHNRRVGFRIDKLPDPPPIFGLIQKSGHVPSAEMYRVFNMGIGFGLIVPNDPSTIDAVTRSFASGAGGVGPFEARVVGEVVADDRKRVFLEKQNLVGEGELFS